MTTPAPRRIAASLSAASLALSGLALLGAGAGIGYAAGQIGTNQIKNNAVTTAKVKNKTLTVKDMVVEEKQKKAVLSNGGDGDCVWLAGDAAIPDPDTLGIGVPTYRMDRFGTVHLSGIAVPTDAPGGDGDCNGGSANEAEDYIAFVLPKKYVPAKTLVLPLGSAATSLIIVGPNTLVSGDVTMPAGAVAVSGGGSTTMVLDNVSYLPAGSKTVANRVKPSGRITPRTFAFN